MLTALYYGWDCPNVPYSISETYNLYVAEYSDHSSYSEIINFVQAVKPKVIKPILDNNQAFGLMKEWKDFHDYRIDMSPLKGYLSKLPVKLLKRPADLKSDSCVEPSCKKPRIMQQIKHRIYYRGPKGAVYETLSEENTISSIESVAPVEHFLTLNKLKDINAKLDTMSQVTKADLNELNKCLDTLAKEIN